jgi:DNA-binding XRE family transcriptional regulator/DNA-binding transcriptional MerR regulator
MLGKAMDAPSLSSRVAQSLNATGLTNDELAQILGVNKNTISAYRNKKGDLKGKVLQGLSEHFDINPEWLLTGNGEMYKTAISTPDTEDTKDTEDPEKLMGQAFALLSKILNSRDPRVIRAILSNLEVFGMTIEMQKKDKNKQEEIDSKLTEYEARIQRLERQEEAAGTPAKKNGTNGVL